MKVVVVGGGVIGLSIAYELAKRNCDVTLLEKDQFGKKASWAGAGIIIPANADTAIHPMEHLEAVSHSLHETWSEELLAQTQIDNGFSHCGGLYVARSNGEVASLVGSMLDWTERKIEFEDLTANQLRNRFGIHNSSIEKSLWVPSESQISNPDHLNALVAVCTKLGVNMQSNVQEINVELISNSAQLSVDEQHFGSDCQLIFACGPWTEDLVQNLNVPLPMQPVRGQIVLYKVDPATNRELANGPIINEGSRYIVPRRDGHILAGSTIEEAGFSCVTTDEGVSDVRSWAEGLVEALNNVTFVKAWAGLRPATYDGFPYLGRLGELENAFVATGHFKGGLHLSTGTAVVISDLVEGKNNPIDISCLSPNRAADHQSTEIK